MASKKSRSLKVYGMSGYRYRSTPTIQLKGEWLKEMGFDIGDTVYNDWYKAVYETPSESESEDGQG